MNTPTDLTPLTPTPAPLTPTAQADNLYTTTIDVTPRTMTWWGEDNHERTLDPDECTGYAPLTLADELPCPHEEAGEAQHWADAFEATMPGHEIEIEHTTGVVVNVDIEDFLRGEFTPDWTATNTTSPAKELRETIESNGLLLPMMNHSYPVPGMTALDAAAYNLEWGIHANCVAVHLGDGEYGFALTGEGTDMTGAIVWAYMHAGYLPPVCFADSLPSVGTTPNPVILAACRRSLAVRASRAARALDRFEARFPTPTN